MLIGIYFGLEHAAGFNCSHNLFSYLALIFVDDEYLKLYITHIFKGTVLGYSHHDNKYSRHENQQQ
ncbi:hypothetical protein D3C80_1682500 [compost metagenome]